MKTLVLTEALLAFLVAAPLTMAQDKVKLIGDNYT